jgi:AcrR family transcriptional regulator
MGRPREHDERTRVALLDAAEQVAQQHGPAAVSMRTVAEAAGTSTRALYSLFGSKAGLLDALATRLFELLAQAVDAVPLTDDPAADVITASVDGFRAVALGHPSLYSLVFLRVVPDLPFGPQYQQAAGAAFERLESLLRRVQAADGLHGLTVRDAARAVHALTEGLVTVELRDGGQDPERAQEHWRASLGALLRGFARAPLPAGAGLAHPTR